MCPKPSTMVKLQKVATAFINAVKAPIWSTLNMPCDAWRSGLQPIQTKLGIVSFLKDCGVEHYTFKPNPDKQVAYVLRGLPPALSVTSQA